MFIKKKTGASKEVTEEFTPRFRVLLNEKKKPSIIFCQRFAAYKSITSCQHNQRRDICSIYFYSLSFLEAINII
jgi:hypothetical protein